MKKAIITGIAGQDGAFLAKLLIDKGYEVIGADRRRTDTEYWRLEDLGIREKIKFEFFDLLEVHNIDKLIKKHQPQEFYNLAAQSFVQASFDMPILTSDIDAMGVLRILESIRNNSPSTKLYQASTSEMFGKVQEIPQSEKTPFYPRSPYGVAKLYAHWMVINYREAYNLFACSGILFNHESEYRGNEFVTQKIINHAVKQVTGASKTPLELGNLDAKRDWGYAKDYVYGMYLMLQQEKPDDYILATNKTVSVREFVETVYNKLNLPLTWVGSGLEEKGISENGKTLVQINPAFFRPTEVDILIGDYSKAKRKLNWTPETDLNEMTNIMIEKAKIRLKK